jgi:hypothetical protein
MDSGSRKFQMLEELPLQLSSLHFYKQGKKNLRKVGKMTFPLVGQPLLQPVPIAQASGAVMCYKKLI